MSTDAQKRASLKYNKSRYTIVLRPSETEGNAIKSAASSVNESMQNYILQAVRERMEREQTASSANVD